MLFAGYTDEMFRTINSQPNRPFMKKQSPWILILSLIPIASIQYGVGSERPNIVLIIADDMNWNDCGAYGHPTIRTPHIDALANEGMRFDRAYLTASSCSPSRASIITGRYPHNTGAEQLHWPLPPDSETFVKQLHDAGYYTAAAGKWHLGNHVKHHFDRIYEASTAGFQLPSGKDGKAPKMVATKPSGCEHWDVALKNRPNDKPFFLWLAALDPHREYEPGTLEPPHTVNDVIVPDHLPDTPDVREDLRMYYDEIGRLDKYVGQVVGELQRQQELENTAIFFISDNGRPFPRDKTTLYEGGIKTPWIVRWPKMIKQPSVTESRVSSVDLAPTIVEMAGLPALPAYSGKSITPILKNPKEEIRQYAFAEDHWHDYEDHGRAIIGQRFKLIRNDYSDLAATPSADAGRSFTWKSMLQLEKDGKLTPLQRACFLQPRPNYELFDLENDPNESNNLANSPEHRDAFKRLKTELDAWAKRTHDYLPSKRTPDEFDRVTGQPDHSVRVRPRRSKKEMFGTYGKY